MSDRFRGAVPLGQSGDVTTKGGLVSIVHQNPKKGSCLLVEIRQKLGLNLDDERRGYDREKTGLLFASVHIHCITLSTHEYQGNVHIFVVLLHEVLIVFFSPITILFVESGAIVFMGRPSNSLGAAGAISVLVRGHTELDTTYRLVVHPALRHWFLPCDPD